MNTCLNCGKKISDNYCQACGQKSSTARYSLKIFTKEIFDSIIHLDSNFFRTFKALLIKPGIFIRDYLMGQRVNYASPLKYFFIILAFNIAVTFILGKPAIAPARIESANISFYNQFVTLLISLIFLLILIPFAFGLKISNKSTAYFGIEYYSFLLYNSSQSILIFIFLQLIFKIFGVVLKGPVEGAVWFFIFTIYIIRSYTTFSGDSKIKSVMSILTSYLIAFIVLFIILIGIGNIINFFIE